MYIKFCLRYLLAQAKIATLDSKPFYYKDKVLLLDSKHSFHMYISQSPCKFLYIKYKYILADVTNRW